MTVTVNVRTRAVGATVKIGEVETEVPARSDKDFFVDGTLDLTITEADPAATAENPNPPLDNKNVPGRQQNDELTKPADGSSFDHDGDGKPGGSLPKSKASSKS